MISRDLPSYSQLLDVADPEFQWRACGAATLAMILGGCGLDASPSVEEVLTRGRAIGAYHEGQGWLHRELAALARSYGVAAHPEDWSGDPALFAWEHLEDAVARGPVIASVASAFSPSKDSHLIAVTDLSAEHAVVYDPYRPSHEAVRYEVPLAFLKEHWTGRIICIHAQER